MSLTTPILAAIWISFIIELVLLTIWVIFISKYTNKDPVSSTTKDHSNVPESVKSSNIEIQIHDYAPNKTDENGKSQTSADNSKRSKSDDIDIQKEMQRNKVSTALPSIFKILVTSSLLWALLCNGTPIVIEYAQLYNHSSYCVYASVPTMFLSRFFMVWFFFKRIELSFANTPLAYSDKTIKCIRITMFTTYPLAIVFYFVLRIVVWCDPNKMMIAILLTVLNDFIWSIFLLQLFIRKLKQLLHFDGAMEGEDALKYFITKLTILVCVAIVSTILILFLFAATRIPATVTLDMVINSFCLLLSFVFADEYYKKICILCRKCTVNG